MTAKNRGSLKKQTKSGKAISESVCVCVCEALCIRVRLCVSVQHIWHGKSIELR